MKQDIYNNYNPNVGIGDEAGLDDEDNQNFDFGADSDGELEAPGQARITHGGAEDGVVIEGGATNNNVYVSSSSEDEDFEEGKRVFSAKLTWACARRRLFTRACIGCSCFLSFFSSFFYLLLFLPFSLIILFRGFIVN